MVLKGCFETVALPSRFPGSRGRILNVFLVSSEMALLSRELPFLRVNDALQPLDFAGFFGNGGKCKEQLAETCHPEQESVH